MPDKHKLLEELKFARDEARLKIHLASKDAQDEWADLEKRWHARRGEKRLGLPETYAVPKDLV